MSFKENRKWINFIPLLFCCIFRYELYQRMSGEREVDALRAQTIAAIAKYVKDNPKAKREDLQKEIAKHIFAFAHKINTL